MFKITFGPGKADDALFRCPMSAVIDIAIVIDGVQQLGRFEGNITCISPRGCSHTFKNIIIIIIKKTILQ